MLRALLLRQAGLTLDAIVNKLSEEFGGPPVVPDRSTIFRHLKRLDLEEFAEDLPFRWGRMRALPFEASRLVLDAQTHWGDRSGLFTERIAKWIWRVTSAMGLEGPSNRRMLVAEPQTLEELLAMPVPGIADIYQVAQEYAWRELAKLVWDEPFDTLDLDTLLAYKPWDGRDNMARYMEMRDDELGFNWVTWHIHDLDWLSKLNPAVSVSLRRHKVKEQRDPFADARFLRATDGLVLNQIGAYALAVDQDWEATEEPWYFEILREELGLNVLKEVGLYER